MSTHTDEQLLLGTAEVARLLGVHRHTVRRLVGEGVLREIRLTPRSHARFLRSEIIELLESAPVGDPDQPRGSP